jgi:replicative DNA helicase
MEEITKTQKETTKKRFNKTGVYTDLMQHSKLPPQAVDLEEAVLGAMMLEPYAVSAVIDLLKPDTFYKEAHQKIFSVIFTLFNRSEPVDILTVTNELKKTGNLEIVGGAYYITQLTNRVASSANIEFHTRIVIQKYIQRELIRICSQITKTAYEDSTDVLELLDEAEKNLFSIGEDNIRKSGADMKSLIKEAIHTIENASKMEGHLTGVGTGFTRLDHITGGWQRSDLIIIASRPSMGKTAFTLTMARNMAVDFKKPVAYFSLEMSALQLVTRLISSESEIEANKIRNGKLDKDEWDHLHSRINQLSEAPLYIDDTPALTVFELRAKCRRLKQQYKIEAVFVDYIQLMAGTDGKGNREQEISSISRSLKSLAKELNIPVIALSQLSRAVETRGGIKRPQLSDLRESGAIEQDADLVAFIYRPEYYKINEDEGGNPIPEGMAEVIIAKHRNGAIATVKLRFLNRFAKFEEYTEFPDNDSDMSNISENTNFDKGPTTIIKQSKMNDDDNMPY